MYSHSAAISNEDALWSLVVDDVQAYRQQVQQDDSCAALAAMQDPQQLVSSVLAAANMFPWPSPVDACFPALAATPMSSDQLDSYMYLAQQQHQTPPTCCSPNALSMTPVSASEQPRQLASPQLMSLGMAGETNNNNNNNFPGFDLSQQASFGVAGDMPSPPLSPESNFVDAHSSTSTTSSPLLLQHNQFDFPASTIFAAHPSPSSVPTIRYEPMPLSSLVLQPEALALAGSFMSDIAIPPALIINGALATAATPTSTLFALDNTAAAAATAIASADTLPSPATSVISLPATPSSPSVYRNRTQRVESAAAAPYATPAADADASSSLTTVEMTKVYSCRLCDKTFRRKADCIRHGRIHTGEKPYKCPGCDESFARQDALKRHQAKAGPRHSGPPKVLLATPLPEPVQQDADAPPVKASRKHQVSCVRDSPAAVALVCNVTEVNHNSTSDSDDDLSLQRPLSVADVVGEL
ncbi:hypothetical protein RI367_007575 [Sorochytrium milnesiophthora]